MVGRKQKPTQLKLVEGTLRPNRTNHKEPKPTGDLSDPRKGLSEAEQEVWDYVISKAPKGLLKSLDFSTLEIWVTAYVYHQDAKEKVKISGQVIKTPSGYPVLNPYMANVNKQALIMLKASAEMGFTPASRSRIHVEPDTGEENPFAFFAISK